MKKRDEKKMVTDATEEPAVSETAASKKPSDTQTKSMKKDLGLQHAPDIFFPIT